jgi:phosphoribosylformylglycinamidine cyclo-ligase
MYQVYNMGHRMEIYCRPEDTDAILAMIQTFGIDAQVIGRTEASQMQDSRNHITIENNGDRLEY